MKFNPNKHYLGTLCKRGHEWEASGQSLRYTKKNYCVICACEHSVKWQEENPEKCKQTKRKATLKWRQKNPKKYKKSKQKSDKKYRIKNLEHIKKNDRKYYLKNKDKIKKYTATWQKNNPKKRKKYNQTYYKKEGVKEKIRQNEQKYRDLLYPCYVKSVLNLKGFKTSQITPELIKINRYTILIHRTLQQTMFKNKNLEKYYLGKLCKRKHELGKSKKSLRFKSNKNCVECKEFTQKQRKLKIKEVQNDHRNA
jgi:hypothetical protein